ncbi:hypothetical protein [Streptomyces cyanogenus]|uniref:hypothetical protein n=1 Tax=Streptomyces cyanogenus TaxID=80860 RepID=UPI001AA0CD92|nr:hypothetical protein [Streptomyces cyanogenus]
MTQPGRHQRRASAPRGEQGADAPQVRQQRSAGVLDLFGSGRLEDRHRLCSHLDITRPNDRRLIRTTEIVRRKTARSPVSAWMWITPAAVVTFRSW